MRINYIIGNGFDINLNLKTSYIEFVKEYKKVENEEKVIKSFKSTLENDSNLWSDLESYLGDYTKNIKVAQDFIKIYDDLQLELSKYLINEQSTLETSKLLGEKIMNDFVNPQNLLLPNDKRNLISLFENHSHKKIALTISTFNYTNSVEQILNSFKFPIHTNTSNIYKTNIEISKINHIHGLVDDGLIFGVNDESQIANKALSNNIDIQEHLIKPFANDSFDVVTNQIFERDIRSSDLICLHGVSLGESDKKWWKIIGEELKKGKHLIYHKFSKNGLSNLNKNKVNPIIRKEKNRLLEKFEIQAELHEKIKSQIYIEIGNKVFSVSE
ncbi:MAG: AbiH family protein [Cellulophaga sp.]